MKFFIYCTYNDLFFCGSGNLNFSSNFSDCMFFSGIAYALGELEDFLDKTEENLCIEDFVIYQKGDIC